MFEANYYITASMLSQPSRGTEINQGMFFDFSGVILSEIYL